MSETTIKLEKDVRDRLMDWKRRHGCKSMSQAVAALLRDGPDADEDDGNGGGVAAMDVGSGDEAEEERIEQTLSYRILARDSKALKYHTGLRPDAQAWLMAALRDAVRFSRAVAVLVVRTSGVVFGRRLCGILWLMESLSHRTTKLWGGLRGIGAIPTLAFESSTRTTAFCSSCSECGVACPLKA